MFPGEKIAVALSGGKDSVALFHALIAAEDAFGIKVSAINIEHGIRGENSLKDSAFVEELCESLGRPLISYSVNVPDYAQKRGISIETAARELRYSCFFKAIDDGLCDRIATAHHAGDNTETVLLNVFRGSGLQGLCGIPERAYDGKIIRPMLSATRDEIDAYVRENSLPFVTDDSNFDDDYSRNFLRNRVIPLIKQRYPDLDSAVTRLSALCENDQNLLMEMAESAVSVSESGVNVSLKNELAPPLLSRAVIAAMKRAGLKKDYEAVHVNAVCALANANTGAEVNLPHGYCAVKGYGKITIFQTAKKQNFSFEFKEGTFNLPRGVLKIKKVRLPKMDQKAKVAFFAQKRANGSLFVNTECVRGALIRTRREGDIFKKFSGGTRPLKEYFIDEKVERRLRDDIPVGAIDNKILFIGGMEISADAALGKDDAEAYSVTYEKILKENTNV